MMSIFATLAERWHRRWWRPDPLALAAFDSLAPVVVVTGASDGIGLALAHRYAAQNRDVVMIARNSARLEVAAAELRTRTKTRVMTVAADVAAPDLCARLDATLAAHRGYCDILVNSAGVGAAGAFASLSQSTIQGLLATNVTALTLLCHHVLADQLVRGRGGIINIASLGAYVPGPQQAAYFASKSYVLSLSEAIASEIAGRGVHVMAVAPGPVDTQFHDRMGASTAWYRFLVPGVGAARVARAATIGFRFKRRVVVPGLVNRVLMVALRALPHPLTLPIVAFLLAPRGRAPNK